MKPLGETEDDPAEEVKSLLASWSRERSFKEHVRFVAIWCALEGQGFSDIRLRREPYERVHRLWRFSMKRGSQHRTFLDIERAVRSACKSLGYSVCKDSVAAMVAGARARGVFMLSNNFAMVRSAVTAGRRQN